MQLLSSSPPPLLALLGSCLLAYFGPRLACYGLSWATSGLSWALLCSWVTRDLSRARPWHTLGRFEPLLASRGPLLASPGLSSASGPPADLFRALLLGLCWSSPEPRLGRPTLGPVISGQNGFLLRVVSPPHPYCFAPAHSASISPILSHSGKLAKRRTCHLLNTRGVCFFCLQAHNDSNSQ